MPDDLLFCPACGSTLRIEIVHMTKPEPGEQLDLEQARPRLVPQRDVQWRNAMAAITRVAVGTGVTITDLSGRSRTKRMVRIRQAAMAAAIDTGASYALVGELLDRDHTTVMHGVRAHRARAA